MKHLHRIALALCLAMPLAACAGTLEGAAQSLSSNTPLQASTLKAAGDMYVIADHAVTAAMTGGKVSKDLERKITPVEKALFDALTAGRAAEKNGNSPAVGAALSLFNQNYADLAKLVPGLGG